MKGEGRRRKESVTAYQVAITSRYTTDKKMQFLFLAVSFPFFLDAQTYLTYRVNRGFGSSQFYHCSYSTMNLTSSQLSD
jgi:hypothetical protein